MNVNTLLKIIGLFVARLEAAVARHENEAMKRIKAIEALELQKAAHFTAAVRGRLAAKNIKELVGI